MELYLFERKDESFKVYSRSPQDIMDLIAYYYEQNKAAGDLESPNAANWSKQVPKLDDIARVESGFIRYHLGIINLNSKDVDMNSDLFSEQMQVTNDFQIAASPESISYFDMQRKQLPSLKRINLYKFQISGIFGGLNFIPEDVMEGINGYDLTQHSETSKNIRANVQRVKAGHPGLA